MKKYDLIVVGAGPTGIFTCYELVQKKPELKILLVDKGLDIYKRSCPILQKKRTKCPPAIDSPNGTGCYPACSITNGFGGAGAYSDGKFNITTEFGGWMAEYRHPSEVLELIKYVDEINMRHGACATASDPNTPAVKEIEKRGLAVGLKLLRAQIKHLGTEQNLVILKNIFEFLKPKIDMAFETEVAELIVRGEKGERLEIEGVRTTDGESYFAKKVVVAPGRDGSEWLANILKSYNLKVSNNQVDVGVRVETLDTIMEDINKNLYEGKFLYRTTVGTTVRSFCNNPSGYVVIENYSGVMLANGHAYKDKKLSSGRTNFALLVSHKFSHPFDKPNEYAKSLAKLANDLANGSILLLKFVDIL